jgi:hypothetical protein
MSTTATTPDLPIPAGAVWAEWQDPGTPHAFRLFNGSERVIARSDAKVGIGNKDMLMFIGGTQRPDGTVERHILPPDLHPDMPITPEQAIELGRALVELGFEAQQMTKLDQQLDA